MKIEHEELVRDIILTALVVIMALSLVLTLGGCASVFGEWSEESVPGDPFIECLRKEGDYPRIRTGDDLGDEVWCEWYRRFADRPFVRIAFDRTEWDQWHKTITIEHVDQMAFDKEGNVWVNGTQVERPDQPKAKWIRYDFRALPGSEAYSEIR